MYTTYFYDSGSAASGLRLAPPCAHHTALWHPWLLPLWLAEARGEDFLGPLLRLHHRQSQEGRVVGSPTFTPFQQEKQEKRLLRDGAMQPWH